jgi:hypothetical protein
VTHADAQSIRDRLFHNVTDKEYDHSIITSVTIETGIILGIKCQVYRKPSAFFLWLETNTIETNRLPGESAD